MGWFGSPQHLIRKIFGEGAAHDIGQPMTYAQMKIRALAECKNGSARIMITAMELLLLC